MKLAGDPIFAECPTLCECATDDVRLTARELAWAAECGHAESQAILGRAIETLGWAVKTITLLAPQTVVVGGGVSLLGEEKFYRLLCAAVERYVFPPLAGTYDQRPGAGRGHGGRTGHWSWRARRWRRISLQTSSSSDRTRGETSGLMSLRSSKIAFQPAARAPKKVFVDVVADQRERFRIGCDVEIGEALLQARKKPDAGLR